MKKLILTLFSIVVFSFSAANAAELTNVQKTAIDENNQTLIRTYTMSIDADMENDIPSSFSEDGYIFMKTDLVSTDIINTYEETVSTTKTRTTSNRFGPSAFAKSLVYEQDGFTGTIARDDNTFKINPTGSKNVSKTVSATKKYSGLVRNDMSAIDRTYKGMSLSHVEWYDQNTGQSVKGYSEGLPGPYSCVAYYTGTQTSAVTTGYSASITYSGIVSKRVVTGHEATVTYIGVRIPEPEPVIEDITNQANKSTEANNLLFPILASTALILTGGIMGLFYFFRKKRGGN